ncbi:Zn-dependent dipeptidase [Hahella chejuensis KCTC 2396]|uniref:Zn-dependent dipeptidase n=1 Tax=Hahella chejuensis (strain KCTC 2396) TaxID=349521 RepID=Q2SKP9_HAHCH|nr:dipeptidase [Hahella chejuensis]ABC28775.1 Zn-dependent dipeptidase [Hahella chejuensis KCTC 2396]
MKKKILTGLLITLIIAVLSFFALVPPLVDNASNQLTASAPKPATDKAKNLHQSLFLADLHSDSLLWGRNLSKGYQRGHMDLPRLREGGMALQAFSVVTKVPFGLNIQKNAGDSDMIFWLGLSQAWSPSALQSLLSRAERQAEMLRDLAASPDNKFKFILNRKDLQDFIALHKTDKDALAGWLTLEGAQAMEGDLKNLNALYEAGFRMIAPTHFFDTELSGSAHGVNKGGLTALGKQWVKAMEDKSMIIDLAHASPKTITDVLTMARRPVIVSHTGVKGTCNNNRNLSDAQLKAIAANGGVVGIGFWSTAVCGRDAAAIARSIKYTVNLIGVDHVAMGSDFDGAVATPFDVTRLDALTEALQKAGLSERQIRKIMGENIRDFLLKNLPSA